MRSKRDDLATFAAHVAAARRALDHAGALLGSSPPVFDALAGDPVESLNKAVLLLQEVARAVEVVVRDVSRR